MPRPASLMIGILLLAAPAYAQDRTAEIDRIFSFVKPDAPGCVVGVAQHGNRVATRAYGLADVERRTPLGTGSVFDIGSTQKQFVAAAVLLLAEEGRLSLADDVHKHLPELPQYGHTVTVDHLLTHTGGLRDWTGLLPLAEEGQDALGLILRQRGLNFTPGEQWSYSNSGYVLLREIVARVSGMPFPEFLRRRVFEPLGMKSSAYVADALQGNGDVALAYEREGPTFRRHMRLGANRGGGALLSTVGDLLLWNEALSTGRLGPFVTTRLQQTARLRNGRKLNYARGLIVQPDPAGTVVWHSGGAAGYSTWLGRLPDHGLSLAVLCNVEPISATSLASQVADLFLPPDRGIAGARERAAEDAGAAGADVSARAGLFFEERTGEPLRLVVNGERLQVAGGPSLVAFTADRFRSPRASLFFRSQDEFELRFLSPDRLELRSMEGQVTHYRRAQPWTPPVAELRAIDGRYRSEDVSTVFELVPGEGRLVMRFESTPEKAVELTPVDRDTYMRNLMVVRLLRDGSGRVIGFEYSNPVARGLRFSRLGERTRSAASIAPATPAPATSAPAGSRSAVLQLEALTGVYELAPGRSISITLEGGQLHGEPTGNPKRPLRHLSGATFGVGEVDSTMTGTFTLGPDGRASALVLRQNGRERTLRRVQ